jgi:hypothetical protein
MQFNFTIDSQFFHQIIAHSLSHFVITVGIRVSVARRVGTSGANTALTSKKLISSPSQIHKKYCPIKCALFAPIISAIHTHVRVR